VHLADPALACAALGYDPDRLADDPDQFAAIFTAMVVHDLRVYLEGTGAGLCHRASGVVRSRPVRPRRAVS